MKIKYHASPTLAKFHKSKAFVKGVMGPVGSGKSTGCCFELMMRAQQQRPNMRGEKRTRWAIIRNTYRELKDTTLKTWLEWFPEDVFGKFNHGDMRHNINISNIHMEVIFRALDKPKDIAKLLSLELTGAWINEAREVPKGILDTLTDRVRRFPPKREGGATYPGIIMDTNPPDDDSWWYRLAEMETPNGWEFYRQPGGLTEEDGIFIENPHGENTKNLDDHYYLVGMAGKDPDYIRVYYCGQYGFVREGKPVWGEYIDHIHCPGNIYEPNPLLPIYIGIDFGLTPAASIGQRTINGKWVIFDELVTEDMGTTNFAKLLGQMLRAKYPDFRFDIYGDPAGDVRSQTDEKTPFQILRKYGINAKPAYTNDFLIRRDAVGNALTLMVEGRPGFEITPQAKILRKAMNGGYCYKRMQVSGADKFADRPDKNKYSHVAESLQYMFIGAGEGFSVVRSMDNTLDLNKIRDLERKHLSPQFKEAIGDGGPLDW
jgi:hypothetical protein